MKIGILTFHFVNNSGAILQCIALQSAVNKFPDVDAEVINYQPHYHTNIYNSVINPFLQASALVKSLGNRNASYKAYRFIRNVASSLLKNLFFIERGKKKKVFSTYYCKYLKLSELCENTQELRQKCGDYDLYIVGSDQLWNSHITNFTIDPAYYLDFVTGANSRMITYAVSASIKEAEIPKVKELVAKFDAVSVREKKSYEQLKSIVADKIVRIDLDPTMLLEKEDYAKLEEAFELPDRYILFYGLATQDDSLLIKTVEQLEEEAKIPVIDISPVRHRLRIKTKRNKYYSPGQFLTAIKNAEYVVTNSFHGTVFSILYTRNFYTIPPTLHPERIEFLLNKLGLQERLVSKDFYPVNPVDWEKIHELLEKERTLSKEYLYGEIARGKEQL